jgi:adenylylsulfate kinase-like enzyme
MLLEHLRSKKEKVEYLDGDDIRDLFKLYDFDKISREAHIKRIAHTGSLLEKHGVNVIICLISPDKSTRNWARSRCQNFIEIYLATSLVECERRDTKGLYKRARRGEIKHFTGIDSIYEAPEQPELIVNTENETASQSFDKIKRLL